MPWLAVRRLAFPMMLASIAIGMVYFYLRHLL